MRRITTTAFSAVIMWAVALRVLAADTPATFKVSEFTFTRPASWEWVDVGASAMRKAQLKIPGKDRSESAEVVFYYFGEGGAGGTQANVNRWLSQFQEPRDKINAKSEEVAVGKRKVTFVQAEGTYMRGMPGGGIPPVAAPNSLLIGAIVEGEQGSVLLKAAGPANLVTARQ